MNKLKQKNVAKTFDHAQKLCVFLKGSDTKRSSAGHTARHNNIVERANAWAERGRAWAKPFATKRRGDGDATESGGGDNAGRRREEHEGAARRGGGNAVRRREEHEGAARRGGAEVDRKAKRRRRGDGEEPDDEKEERLPAVYGRAKFNLLKKQER